MKDPDFGSWIQWQERSTMALRKQPGIYLIARFLHAPPEHVDPIAPEIVYIGETCSQTLEKRLRSFHRAITESKRGHSGGLTFYSKYSAQDMNDPTESVHVAVLPVKMSEPEQSAYIRYIERKLILEYVQKHGVMPACNRK